jgi:hypothetical protein
MSPDYGPHKQFDVLRVLGKPVTITPAHCAGEAEWTEDQRRALLHAWGIRCVLVERHGRHGVRAKSRRDVENEITLINPANLSKSRLMGRMMYDGLPPLQDPPPVVGGGPDYSVSTD